MNLSKDLSKIFDDIIKTLRLALYKLDIIHRMEYDRECRRRFVQNITFLSALGGFPITPDFISSMYVSDIVNDLKKTIKLLDKLKKLLNTQYPELYHFFVSNLDLMVSELNKAIDALRHRDTETTRRYIMHVLEEVTRIRMSMEK